MDTNELIINCSNSRVAASKDVKNKTLQDKADAAYKALFAQDHISEMLRASENAIPGIRVYNPNDVTPVYWDDIKPKVDRKTGKYLHTAQLKAVA